VRAAHRLETRARTLTARLNERVTAFRDALAPPGQRPPFTEAMSRAQALQWWAKHRLDDLGKQALARYTPDQVAELDAELARHLTAQQDAGLVRPVDVEEDPDG
jgi:hypothetical protein